MLDKQIPTVHANGINKDRTFQDKNDVTFALNAIRDSHDGGRQEYQSEPGNQLSFSLPTGYLMIGSIYGQNDEVYIFSTNNVLSEIGLFKQDRYTTLANLNLGFNNGHPITGEYRVRNGCERTIYWADGFNHDYWFNVDQPNDFKTSGVFDPNKFKFVPNISCPKIDLVRVNSSGGNLPLGSFYFQLELVDKDGNSLYKTDVSPQTIIYDEDQSDAYNNIDGGLNAPQYDPAIGGLPATNKSITLRFSNLDTTFEYLRINVVRQITGNDVVDAHSVGALIPISNSEIEWTYRGYNVSSGDYPVDYSSLTIPNIKYKSSNVQEQVQGRLVRGDLRQDTIDYSQFQKAASLITAQWVAKEIETSDQFDLGSPKNPNTYWDCTTFQGDEVYAFAIEYLLTNGDWTPKFPLIRKQASIFEATQLLVVDNATAGPLPSSQVWKSDVDHVDPADFESFVPGYTGSMIRRWKVFNTASITTSNTVTHPYNYIGEFGFYESRDSTYPDIQDCNGHYIWGTDSGLNQIIPEVTKLRYFRFPDRRLVPHVTGTNGAYLQPLGVKFDNITYPSPDIVGHRFCHAVRDAANKTVLDSGWFSKQYDNINLEFAPVPSIVGMQLSPINTSVSAPIVPASAMIYGRYGRYNSGEVMFNNKIFNPDYLKFNRCYRYDFVEIAPPATFPKAGGGNITIDFSIILPEDVDINTRQNYDIKSNLFVPTNSNTTSNFGVNVYALDRFSPDSVIETTYELENLAPLLGASAIGKSDLSYVYKKSLVRPYNNILNNTYEYLDFNVRTSLAASNNVYYNGDSVITSSVVTRVLAQASYTFTVLNYTLYSEEQNNWYLRHGGTNPSNKYCKINGDYDWLLDKISDLTDDGKYEVRSVDRWDEEYYAYNTDFSVQTREVGKVGLPLNYDYCSDCLNEYPNRLIFSPKSFEEESFDLYRINKINDYIDLPAHRGRITGLKYQNNQLLVHTEDTTFVLQPNPQQIATDQNTAYLTTGDFLSIPPQELLQTDVGTAGLQSKQSQTDTPFGHYWFDQKRGEIFGWNGKLEILSNKGLLQWFKDNGPSFAQQKFFEIEGVDHPIQSTMVDRGIGSIMYYDPRFKRLLITKKDYLPIDQREEFLTPELTVVWSFAQSQWATKNESLETVTALVSDPTRFEDKSWTLSYSFLDQSFTSWHSYIPSHSFSDSNNFYTSSLVSNRNNTYRHLKVGNYQTYSGVKYDFIIEWSNFDPITSSISSIYYVGYSQEWDDINKRFKTVNNTFDRALLYNFEQSTGLQNLILQNQHTNPYQNNKLIGTDKYVIKTDQNYKIAGLVDMAINQPPVTQNWQSKLTYPGYIDLVPNGANIDLTKNQYDWGNLWDKFTFTRLFYKPTEDHKKTVILQVLNSEQSVR